MRDPLIHRIALVCIVASMIAPEVQARQDRRTGTSSTDTTSLVDQFVRAERALATAVAISSEDSPKANAKLTEVLAQLRAIRPILGLPPQEEKILLQHEVRILEIEPEVFAEAAGIQAPDGSGEAEVGFLTEEQVEGLLRSQSNLLMVPTVVTEDRQDAIVEAMSMDEIEYLQRRADGLFELKKETIKDGISLTMKGVCSEDRRFITYKLDAEVAKVVGKTSLDTGAATVGLPIVNSRVVNTTVTVKLSRSSSSTVRSTTTEPPSSRSATSSR